jgi:hypothetical protein
MWINWSHVQWGTVGEWVSGLATASAFYLSYRVFRRDLRDREAAEARARSEQASLVFGKVESGGGSSTTDTLTGLRFMNMNHIAHLTNAGSTPVTDVEVETRVQPDAAHRKSTGLPIEFPHSVAVSA